MRSFRKYPFVTELGIIFESLVIEPVTVKSAVLVIELVTVLFMLYGIEVVILFLRLPVIVFVIEIGIVLVTAVKKNVFAYPPPP